VSYSVDSSALIDAWHKSYRPSVFRIIWNSWFASLVGSGKMLISRSVYEELRVGGDDLFAWIKTQPKEFVVEDTEDVQRNVARIQADWPNKNTDFTRRLTGADLFVVARAIANGGAVVTHEGMAGNLLDPRIPDACGHLKLESISILDMLEREGFTL